MTTTERPTPQAPQVAVRGEARLEVDPEIARVGVTVSARGSDRRATLADLTRRNALALELVTSYGEAVEKLETSAFSIAPEPGRHGRGERVRAYRGHVRLTAELNDFTALGELTTRLADLELTRVDGPWWGLRPDSPAHEEARRRAVGEAVQRARAYAAALGTSLSALLELSDTGMAPPPALMGGARMAFAAESVDEAPPLDLEPQRQTVTAEVEARFTMLPPTL
ncbi:SIMPL domain-containing protein [Streptomyces sp. ISL-36]|uniref:SIMPL domain-containing protein n=1 Tax=Streptomyces sp. ISL-36 TaxID=2819182 RepID=UPI0027E3E720|nr:SIMPL domain-containing protein [Streptomyces sp. ISL-36]